MGGLRFAQRSRLLRGAWLWLRGGAMPHSCSHDWPPKIETREAIRTRLLVDGDYWPENNFRTPKQSENLSLSSKVRQLSPQPYSRACNRLGPPSLMRWVFILDANNVARVLGTFSRNETYSEKLCADMPTLSSCESHDMLCPFGVILPFVLGVSKASSSWMSF